MSIQGLINIANGDFEEVFIVKEEPIKALPRGASDFVFSLGLKLESFDYENNNYLAGAIYISTDISLNEFADRVPCHDGTPIVFETIADAWSDILTDLAAEGAEHGELKFPSEIKNVILHVSSSTEMWGVNVYWNNIKVY